MPEARGPNRRRDLVLALIPLAMMAHNTEEALTVRGYLPELQRRAAALGLASPVPSTEQYHAALVVIPLIAIILYLLSRTGSNRRYPIVVVQAVMALNVLIHAVAAAWTGGYVPGLATAALVELPTSILVYRVSREMAFITPRQWAMLPFFAVLVHGMGLLAMFALLRRL
jgi:hypothetical protein